MKTIYIVLAEFGVAACFSTEEKAKEFIQTRGTDYYIEALEVDSEKIHKEMSVWRVNIGFKSCDVYEAVLCEDDWYKDTFVYDESYSGTENRIKVYVEADCIDNATKVARERLAQIKAKKDTVYAKAFVKVLNCAFGYPLICYNTGEIVKKV
jgi:hypothetical protein